MELNIRTTAHDGSNGIATNLYATGTQTQVTEWAERKAADGKWKTEIYPPSKSKSIWSAHATLIQLSRPV